MSTSHDPSTPARFATQRQTPSSTVVTAHGDIDAANAAEFETHAGNHSRETKNVVIDLTGVEFFGTAGLSALQTAGRQCTADGVRWAIVPSAAVRRLLAICDVDPALPTHQTVDGALGGAELLELIPEPR